jgi:dGTPase
VRALAIPMVGFSQAWEANDAAIKVFLGERMYRHAKVMRVMNEAEKVVRDLFAHYATTPADLPAEWRDGLERADEAARKRRIADYIAGMTDRYALIEHAKYFAQTPELR